MGVALKNSEGHVLPKDLADGDIAIIMSSEYTGRVVQRLDQKLVTLGMPSGHTWSTISSLTFYVRRLGKGETLVVT